MSRRLAPLAAAAAALSLASAAAAAPPRPGARPAAGPTPRAAPALPEVRLPRPLTLGGAAANLTWSRHVDGLDASEPTPQTPPPPPPVAAARPRGKKRAHAAAAAMPPQPKTVTLGGSLAFGWDDDAVRYATLEMPCRPELAAPVRWPLRWEAVDGTDAAAPTWTVYDGWYDERSCQVAIERRTALRPAVLYRLEGEALALGARQGDRAFVLVPDGETLRVQALSASLDDGDATVPTRAVVGVGPGRAATIAARLRSADAGELRIEISQTVGERQPAVVVQRFDAAPEDAADPRVGRAP
jgi:hypothetical protein